jgi:hypothetical protein
MPSKVAYFWQFGFLFSTAPTAQNSPELKIHNRNVAKDTSVYYSVAIVCIFFFFAMGIGLSAHVILLGKNE